MSIVRKLPDANEGSVLNRKGKGLRPNVGAKYCRVARVTNQTLIPAFVSYARSTSEKSARVCLRPLTTFNVASSLQTSRPRHKLKQGLTCLRGHCAHGLYYRASGAVPPSSFVAKRTASAFPDFERDGENDATAIAFSPDGSTLFIATDDEKVYATSSNGTSSPELLVSGLDNDLCDMVVSPDGLSVSSAATSATMLFRRTVFRYIHRFRFCFHS